jgi:hypothetical protein
VGSEVEGRWREVVQEHLNFAAASGLQAHPRRAQGALPPDDMRRSKERRPAPARSWLRWLGWFVWIALVASGTVRFAGQAGDDIYITYRYAYNLAHGRGLVFNPGQTTFGLSDPGVAILLAACHRASGLPIPALGTAVTALALLAIAGVLLGAARGAGREPEGWLGGTLLLASPYLWLSQGAGPLPALALLLLATRAASARWPWQAGLLAGLAFCCRPDAALGSGVLALLLAAEDWRRTPIAGGEEACRLDEGTPPDSVVPQAHGVRLARAAVYSVTFAAVAGLAMWAAWSCFGSALPETLAVKRRFAALAPHLFTGKAFWRTFAEAFCALAGRGGPLLLALGTLGLVPLYLRGGRTGRWLVLNSLTVAAFYTAAEVPFFLWYTLPMVVAVVVGGCFLAGELARLGLGPGREWRWAAWRPGWRAGLARVAAGAAGAVLMSFLLGAARWWNSGGSVDWRLFAYRRAGEWIRTHTPPDAEIAFDEVGILGYYGDRPVRDLIGLVSPISRPYAAVGDPLGAFLAAPPELMLFQTYDWRGGTRPILARPWFAGAYEVVAIISDPAAGAETRIYRRRPGGYVPPPRPPWPRRRGLAQKERVRYAMFSTVPETGYHSLSFEAKP